MTNEMSIHTLFLSDEFFAKCSQVNMSAMWNPFKQYCDVLYIYKIKSTIFVPVSTDNELSYQIF